MTFVLNNYCSVQSNHANIIIVYLALTTRIRSTVQHWAQKRESLEDDKQIILVVPGPYNVCQLNQLIFNWQPNKRNA